MTKTILAAAGEQVRWKMHAGRPKHLVRVYGEPLIHRTCRQLYSAWAPNVVILKPSNFKGFAAHGAVEVSPGKPSVLPDTAIGHSYELWEDGADMLILMGDVIWMDQYVPTLIDPPWDTTTFFGIPTHSHNKNPEIMGIFVPSNEHGRVKESMDYVKDNAIYGISKQWQLYRHLHSIPPREHIVGDDFDTVTDGCMDIDTHEDYTIWIQYEMRNRTKRNKIFHKSITG